MKLSDVILEDFGGYNKFQEESEKLEAELRDTYDRKDIHVKIGQYSGRDRGFGKIQINDPDDNGIPDSEYNNMKNILTAKGYQITGGANFGGDDGDRNYYPTIKFEFDIK